MDAEDICRSRGMGGAGIAGCGGAGGVFASDLRPAGGNDELAATSKPPRLRPAAARRRANPAPAVAPTTAQAAAKPAAGGRVQLPTYVAPKPDRAPDVPWLGHHSARVLHVSEEPDAVRGEPRGRRRGGHRRRRGVHRADPVRQQHPLAAAEQGAERQPEAEPGAVFGLGVRQIPDDRRRRRPARHHLFPIGGVIPELPLSRSQVEDLTPFVSGDAVKEYPNLAALPTIGWKGMVYNNKIFAVPLAQSQFYWGLWGHQELLEAKSSAWPKSAAEFRSG